MLSKYHTVENFKRLAKKLKRESNITHTAALEAVAKQNGYANWTDFLRKMKKD